MDTTTRDGATHVRATMPARGAARQRFIMHHDWVWGVDGPEPEGSIPPPREVLAFVPTLRRPAQWHAGANPRAWCIAVPRGEGRAAFMASDYAAGWATGAELVAP